jgi:hypothetical protein
MAHDGNEGDESLQTDGLKVPRRASRGAALDTEPMCRLTSGSEAMNDETELKSEASADSTIAALSLDEKWIADKLSEHGFTMEQLEELYPIAEEVALEWLRQGHGRIPIDAVTSEMKRRTMRRFTNTMRPFFARLLRIRHPELRSAIEVATTSRGRNKNLKVTLDHLNVVAVVVEENGADGVERRTIALAEVPEAVERAKAARQAAKEGRS